MTRARNGRSAVMAAVVAGAVVASTVCGAPLAARADDSSATTPDSRVVSASDDQPAGPPRTGPLVASGQGGLSKEEVEALARAGKVRGIGVGPDAITDLSGTGLSALPTVPEEAVPAALADEPTSDDADAPGALAAPPLARSSALETAVPGAETAAAGDPDDGSDPCDGAAPPESGSGASPGQAGKAWTSGTRYSINGTFYDVGTGAAGGLPGYATDVRLTATGSHAVVPYSDVNWCGIVMARTSGR